MTTIKRLGLNKLFLWGDAQRFHTYPRALARLTPGRHYTRRQVAEELMQLAYDPAGRKPIRESHMLNMFGFSQIADDKILIKGINLFRRVTGHGSVTVSGMKVWEQASDEWVPTDAASQLGTLYRENPKDVAWQIALAEQIVRFEPHIRVLLYRLGRGEHLRFEKPGFFDGNSEHARLRGAGDYALFAQQGAAFNNLLVEHSGLTLGPWWRSELENAGFYLADSLTWEGAANRSPSMNNVNSALKAGLSVFRALNIIKEEDGEWLLDIPSFITQLSTDVTRELIGAESLEAASLNEWQRLAHLLNKMADEQGFVIASEAAERWGKLTDLSAADRVAAFDNLLRRGMYEGHVEVLDRHPGQLRMGRGLFADDNMRMVRLRVLC